MAESIGTSEMSARLVIPLAGRTDSNNQAELDFRLLGEIASRMRAPNLQELLARLGSLLDSLVHREAWFIYLVEGEELVLRASKNSPADAVHRVLLKDVESPAKQAISYGLPWGRASGHRLKTFNGAIANDFQSFVSVPMLSGDQLLGYINLQAQTSQSYSENEVDFLAMVGRLAGAGVEILRLREENSRLSSSLESRKVVEQAKGILQEQFRISEKEAYARLQKQSQQIRKPMKEIAEAIVLTHSVNLFSA